MMDGVEDFITRALRRSAFSSPTLWLHFRRRRRSDGLDLFVGYDWRKERVPMANLR